MKRILVVFAREHMEETLFPPIQDHFRDLNHTADSMIAPCDEIKKYMTGENREYDLLIVYDEREIVLKTIKEYLPSKNPVIYVEIFGDVKPISGLTWFGCGSRFASVLEAIDKI